MIGKVALAALAEGERLRELEEEEFQRNLCTMARVTQTDRGESAKFDRDKVIKALASE